MCKVLFLYSACFVYYYQYHVSKSNSGGENVLVKVILIPYDVPSLRSADWEPQADVPWDGQGTHWPRGRDYLPGRRPPVPPAQYLVLLRLHQHGWLTAALHTRWPGICLSGQPRLVIGLVAHDGRPEVSWPTTLLWPPTSEESWRLSPSSSFSRDFFSYTHHCFSSITDCSSSWCIYC